MPEIARPYLAQLYPALAKAPAEQITKFLAGNPDIAEKVAFMHIKGLEGTFGADNQKAIAGSWISGQGNVNPDGSLKDGSRSDGNLTAQQYVDRALTKVPGNLFAGPGATAPSQVTPYPMEQAALDKSAAKYKEAE